MPLRSCVTSCARKKRRRGISWCPRWALSSARLSGGISVRRQKSRAPFGCVSVLPTEHGRPPGSAQECPSTSLQNKRLERASLGCYLSRLRRMMMTAEACLGEADEREESHDYHAGRREGQRILARDGFHCPQQRASGSLHRPSHKKTHCGNRKQTRL